METNVNYTVVGAFVITMVALIVLTIIWLSAGLNVESYAMYEVYMPEAVSGLSQDAPVEYNGVNVGTVASIQLNKANPRIVELLLKIKSSTPITVGTRATLNTRALTGIAFIALKDQGLDITPLQAKKGQRYPVIPSAPSLFMQLDTALTKLNHSIHEVSVSIRSLLDEQNLRSIKHILGNVQTVTDTLVDNNKRLNTIMLNTEKATSQFVPLMRSSTAAMQLIDSQTIPAANQAIVNLNQITGNLLQVSGEIKQNPAVLIRGKAQPKLGPGEK